MVSTRSQETGQKKLEDFVESPGNKGHDQPSKRKAQPKDTSRSPAKKSKHSGESSIPVKEDADETKKESDDEAVAEKGPETTSDKKDDHVVTLKKSDDTDVHSEPIKINRAPVLDLFASCAAQFEHPDLSWETCLSLGSAVASICAISKGRSIGKIPEKDTDKVSDHKKDETISVLGFDVTVRDGLAYVGDQKKPANESYLKHKYGERFDEVKIAISEALSSWKGHEEEFSKKGFHMYEKFRPGGGQWGQQGGLEVENVKRVIMR